MGRGRRLLRWLRKRLTIRRKKKSKKNKKNKKDGVKCSPSQQSLAQHHQDTGSGNNSSRPERVCADAAVQWEGDTSSPEPHTPTPQQGDNISIHEIENKIETHPLPLLPPSSEVECEASPQPPELELTTTKLGNTAFEVVEEQDVVARKAPEKFQYTHRVFDNEFLRKREERLDKASQRRRQLLEAIKERQREREKERAAARMRKITGDVPSYDDLEVVQEEGSDAGEVSEAVVAEEDKVLEVEDAPEVVVVEEGVAEVEEEKEEECMAVSETEEYECSTSTPEVPSSSDVEQTEVGSLLWSEDTLHGFGDEPEFLSSRIALEAYRGMMEARQKQREASINSWMEFYMPTASNSSPDTHICPEEGNDIAAEEAHGSNATEEAHSGEALNEAEVDHSTNATEKAYVVYENAVDAEEAHSGNDSVDAQVEAEQSVTSTYEDRKQVSAYPPEGVLENQVRLPCDPEVQFLLEMQRTCAVKKQVLIAEHGIKLARLMEKQVSVESFHSRSSNGGGAAAAPEKSTRSQRSHSGSCSRCRTRASREQARVQSLRRSSSFVASSVLHFPAARQDRRAEELAHARVVRPADYPERVVAERRRYLYKMGLWRKARKSLVVGIISSSSADHESSGEEADDEREEERNFSTHGSRSKVVRPHKTRKRSAAPLERAARVDNVTTSKFQTVSPQSKVKPVVRRKPKPVRISRMPWPEDSNAFFTNSSKPVNKSGSSNTLKSLTRSVDEGYSSHLRSFPPCSSKQRSSGHQLHPPRHHHRHKMRLAADDMPCICESGNTHNDTLSRRK